MEEPQVFANSQNFTLYFEIVYITKEFTQYQMKWHYAWIAITLVFMFVPKIGFFYEMMQLHQNFWSRQQVSELACALRFRPSFNLATVPPIKAVSQACRVLQFSAYFSVQPQPSEVIHRKR